MNIEDLLTLKGIFRVLIFIVLFGYCAYSLFLMLRVRILAQTLKTDRSPFVAFLGRIHFLIVIIGSIVAGTLILF